MGGFQETQPRPGHHAPAARILTATADRLPGNPPGTSMRLITHVPDRPGHASRYAIDSTKLQQELHWHPATTFELGIEKTVRWYLEKWQ